jgi:RNA polymerase sigma-70 factor (ECF subfamily)
MSLVADDGSTNSKLLGKVSDWRDHLAWVRFQNWCNPMLRRWCRGDGLDEESIDEVCQLILIELANRMRTFQYDPNRTFRGWLRRLCHSRVLDFLRQRQRQAVRLRSLDERDDEPEAGARGASIDPDERDDADPLRCDLLGEVEKVQAAVRAKVKPRTWEAFWLVAVYDWTVERTAEALGMTHVAVYAARARVAGMLREEDQRASKHGAAGS